jgi:hypothetical protein
MNTHGTLSSRGGAGDDKTKIVPSDASSGDNDNVEEQRGDKEEEEEEEEHMNLPSYLFRLLVNNNDNLDWRYMLQKIYRKKSMVATVAWKQKMRTYMKKR